MYGRFALSIRNSTSLIKFHPKQIAVPTCFKHSGQDYSNDKSGSWSAYSSHLKYGSVFGVVAAVVSSLIYDISSERNHISSKLLPVVQCATDNANKVAIKDETKSLDSALEESDKEDEKKKKRVGFRDRKIINYEDRIRQYSTPDKIFRYFATLKCVYEDGSSEIFMTPDDFVRSITPGIKQPEGLGLDSFKKFDVKCESLNIHIQEDSVFYWLGDKALISFSDYVFLLTVISTPQRQFEIAFRMFDLNGDGELDVNEFELVRSVIRDTTAVGKRHRDHQTTGSTLRRINSALANYFFGEKGDKKLTIATFLDFQSRLQSEIIKLEFARYNPKDGKIRELDFADMLLIYAGYSEAKTKKCLKRIKQAFSGENSKGITFEEYYNFSLLLRNISDIDTALTFYHLAGAAIDQETLYHVTKSVANVDLSKHVLDVVFTLFDENNDGHLSNREFVAVMKQRLMRGLDKSMDTGFVRRLSALFTCGIEQLYFKKID